MSVPLLSVSGVVKRYQGVAALEDVTFTLDANQTTGLIGPNGAGKTTMFNVVSGNVAPDEGRIHWDGADVTREPMRHRYRRGLGRTFQHAKTFPRLTVLENIETAQAAARRSGRSYRDSADLLDMFDLGAYGHRPAGELAHGVTRKLSICLALTANPRLLMLDEPAAGLTPFDVEALVEVLREIAVGGTTLWIIEHNMGFVAQCCERVLVLDAGRLIADLPPDRLASHSGVMAAYLGDGERR